MPPLEGVSGQFLGALSVSHYEWLIGATQVVSGVLFLIGRYVPLAIALSGPVIVNIIAYHMTMQHSGAQPAVLATICWVFLFWRYRDSFAPMWVAKVEASEHRKEQSQMTNEKVIMLIEAKIQPQRRAEVVEAARQYLPLVRAEPGVEAFYLTVRKDDPNTFVFYEIYKSQAAQDSHLQQDFTKKFLAVLKSAQTGDRVRTNLVDFIGEAQARAD